MTMNYETIMVTFGESISDIDRIFDNPQVWGCSTLKEWIDCYESTRFTQIGEKQAIITSEYNMNSVNEWLEKNTPIENINYV